MNVNEIGRKINNDKLLATMKALRENENDDTLRDFFKEATSAVFISPAQINGEPDENGKLVFDGEARVNFALLTSERGEKVIPCFTSDAVITESQFKDFKRIILPYKQLANIILSSKGAISGMAINPFTENCVISSEFVKNYEQSKKNGGAGSRIKQQSFGKGDKIKLRTPKYMPVAMLEEASKYFKQHPEVTRAFLQMLDDGKGDDKYLIVIETAADERPVIEGLLPIVKPHSFGIDLVFMKSTSFVGWKVTTITEPFYTKEGFVAGPVSKPENADGIEEDIDTGDE